MMDAEETAQCNRITWTLANTTSKEVSSILKHLVYMNEAKVDQIEDIITTAYNGFLDTRKLY